MSAWFSFEAVWLVRKAGKLLEVFRNNRFAKAKNFDQDLEYLYESLGRML